MSESSSDEDESWVFRFNETLQRIKRNDPSVELIELVGEYIQNMSDEKCEELGRDIANNTHLKKVDSSQELITDQKLSCLFRGLTRSSSIKDMLFNYNQFSAAGVRSMVPFLQSANNLTFLDLDDNDNIQSEGFNVLFRALSESPIETLSCIGCGIKSIEIDRQRIPYNLTTLNLGYNEINADGCSQLAQLLQGGDATLKDLSLGHNKIDDDGVEILIDALKSNTSLRELYLSGNDAISKRGNSLLLKLVNNISCIEATLRSNHTLTCLYLYMDGNLDQQLQLATKINLDNVSSPEAAGREKVIQTQLHSKRRAEFAARQGVNHSVYSEIDPLHLPEVLALVGHHNGQGELYHALKSSIAELISTVNEKQSIQQQIAYHTARLKELGNRLAVIEAAEEGTVSVESESRCIKRRREC